MPFDFSYSQDSPASLVNRADEVSRLAAVRELSAATSYYGIGDIFREYAGLPEAEPLAFGADHYVPWTEEAPHHSDLTAGLPTFLATTERRAKSYAEQGISNAIGVGSPIHYLRSNLGKRGWHPPETESERRGTIAFPHKSTLGIERNFDYAAFADELVNLPDEYHPVVACVYWQDYLAGRHRAYLEAGLQVITCGHVFDPLFLHRFIDASSRFRYACGNAIGSSYPLAVCCGCKFFLLESGAISENRVDDSTGRIMGHPDESDCETITTLRQLAPFPPCAESFAKQEAFVEGLTGKKFQKTPGKIYEIHDQSRKSALKLQRKFQQFVEPVPLAELNRWLPRGIYTDGWARNSSQLTVRDGRSLILCLLFPDEIFSGARSLRMTVGGRDSIEYSLTPGYYKLWLPLSSGESTMIRFDTATEKELSPEDSRGVALRFLAWRCSELPLRTVPACESIGWPKVEALIASLEDDS